MDWKYLQGQKFHNLSGHPVYVLGLPHSKEIFPDAHTESPVFQFSLSLFWSLGATEKILVPSYLHFPLQYLSTWMRSSFRIL